MFSGGSSLPMLLFVIGLFLVAFAGSRPLWGPSAGNDPLRVAGLSPKERRNIRMMIYRRVLPDDSTLRRWVFERAAYDSGNSRVSFLWAPLTVVGVLLLPCILYEVPGIFPVVVVIQCVCALYYLPLWIVDCRRVAHSKRLIRFGDFESTSTITTDK